MNKHPNMTTERKLNNKFYVSKLLTALDIDFLYSYSAENNEYKLLNQDMFGIINEDIVSQQMIHNRIVIINNETKRFFAYNIPEEEVDHAFMSI